MRRRQPLDRLELPIDHFRLLGVGPSTDAQAVLHMLQQRLNRVPEQGFSEDTLAARADLLRASADLLSDAERRSAYEAALTTLAATGEPMVPALEVPTTKEVAGLVLLLEAGQPLEAFELACRCLQPPQAPALGSRREADLALLAGLACLDAAAEFHQQRRFEAAARTLQEGLQLLQRMGQLPDLRETMNRELDRLIPYRVLDLLSRDLVASEERHEGLALLEQLVQRRGGLEGDGDPNFSSAEFQPFFKQIRGYLTVQEQVDLFSRWGDEGSATADFLATTALTASGFARRKPERIAAARDRLLASGRSGIEPLLANLYLLLGEVDRARSCFAAGAGQELQTWVARRSEDSLGQLCAYCRDWLQRDVLPGYRDLDADPDLEAYFSDRDVTAYVEREDRRTGRAYAPPAAAGGGARAGGGAAATAWSAGGDADLFGPSDFTTGLFSGDRGNSLGAGSFAPPPPSASPASTSPAGLAPDRAGDSGAEVNLPGWRLPPLPWLVGGAAAVAALLLAGIGLLRPRPAAIPPAIPLRERATEIPVQPAPPSAPSAPAQTPAQGQPLTSASPTAEQIQSLLEAWLAAKTAVLAGSPAPYPLDRIARESEVARLRSERRQDGAKGQTQSLKVQVKNLSISERSADRIAATAQLSYSDSRRDRSGKVVGRTAPTTLRNVYVFGRDAGGWRLAASLPAD